MDLKRNWKEAVLGVVVGVVLLIVAFRIPALAEKLAVLLPYKPEDK